MTHRIVNFIFFQIGWFACILGAAREAPIVGPLVVMLLAGGHLVLRRHRLAGELILLGLAAALGYAMDSLLVAGGAVAFPEAARLGGPSPLWMVALWVNLATTLHVSLAWLEDRLVPSAVLGAVAGPLSYAAGAHLGAVTLGSNTVLSLTAIAVEWAVAMPLLVWLAGRTGGAAAATTNRLARVAEAKA